tara:strand:+ start:81 stop:311 length:231 start_codon:yes stop_codon:yes gene_type:complete
MFFKIANTRSEKMQIILYYENVRKEMEKFKNDCDDLRDNKYNNKVINSTKHYYYRVLISDIKNRPAFLEPLTITKK